MHEWTFPVKEVINVVDGDTIDCRISLGFGQSAAFRFRLKDIDTQETHGRNAEPAGTQAWNFTRAWLAETGADDLIVQTFKGSQATVGIGDGAFGRWLAYFIDQGTGANLSHDLRKNGYFKGAGAVLGWFKVSS